MAVPPAVVYGALREEKVLPDLESGNPPEVDAAAAERDPTASNAASASASAGTATSTTDATVEEAAEGASRGDQSTVVRKPLLLRVCAALIHCFVSLLVPILLLIAAVLALACFIICLPCFCCVARRQGRWVILNGTQPPILDEEAKKRIEAAREGAFRVRLDAFDRHFESMRSSLSRTLSKTLTGSQQVPINRSGTFTNNAEVPQEVSHDTTAKREALKRARIGNFEQTGQTIPSGLMIRIERRNALEQTLAVVGAAPAIDLLSKRLNIDFLGEKGIDAGGITRDWFDSLGRSLVEAAEGGNGHLMVLPDKTLAPRPYEERFPELLAIGRLIGLALWFGIPLPIPLGSVTCKFMLDVPISPLDLQRLDPDFVQFRIKPILRSTGVRDLEEALGEPLTFMSAATDRRASKELCEGGGEKRVTEENKQEYLKLLCEHHLCGDMQEQIKVLLEGFWEIFPQDVLICSGLSHRELALLISGYATLDPEVWRSHTDVNSTDCDELITWFWEMVIDMVAEDRAKLLHFATGSSRLPAGGFPDVSPRFNISIQGDQLDHLPQAHTCGNQLVIPKYTSKEQLVEKTKIALANDEGFGFA